MAYNKYFDRVDGRRIKGGGLAGEEGEGKEGWSHTAETKPFRRDTFDFVRI